MDIPCDEDLEDKTADYPAAPLSTGSGGWFMHKHPLSGCRRRDGTWSRLGLPRLVKVGIFDLPSLFCAVTKSGPTSFNI